MSPAESQILDATIEMVSHFGMRKTSMNDIATRAGVSRQTVYNLFGNREDIFHSAIVHMGEQWRARARARLHKSHALADRLDFVFEVLVLDAYKFSHKSPATTDMFIEAYKSAPEAMTAFIAENQTLYREIFEPYEAALNGRGIDLRQFAEMVDITCRGLIREARSIRHLKELLSTHKASILALAGD